MTSPGREEVAIVGLAGRFPGASTVDQLWKNLCEGVESIRPLTAEELAAAGVDDATIASEGYVAAGAPLEDADAFDSSFFGYTRREAEIMDPQHRVFLECAWAALENAGCEPGTYPGRIGVFGGVAPNTYRQQILETRPDVMKMAGRYPLLIGSEREYAITRSAFKLGLQGPAVSVNTACSTSGVAIHLACQSILSGETDVALAGGARVAVPQTAGYVYEEDGILSPDGHCRAFDAQGRGTVVGSGVAIIVLKRLSDALADGDTIRAIIKGTAINNDGDDKIGYTAPGVRGQEMVIREALEMAEVDPSTIGYVEAHGTGTFIGDPIEVEALTRAYRHYTDATGYCGIGSIKTNIGHLDAGAGVAGVVKAVLALETGLIPPNLHFRSPNPQIDFDSSPFRVVDRLTEWPAGLSPRRAAVSSFGLGGTNAHVILEQAPAPTPRDEPRPGPHLLVLSARSQETLDRATGQLADHFATHPDTPLADAAHTLIAGRRRFEHRRAVAVADSGQAVEALNREMGRSTTPVTERPIVFMFPGGGAQHVGMARRLYQGDREFRQWFDRCAELFTPYLDVGLADLVFGGAVADLDRPTHALASLFTVEYALARRLMSLGVEPDLLIGHSMGEYTAACLSGVLALEDATGMVGRRGQLFETLPAGGMLSVPLDPTTLQERLNGELSIAVVNKPELCIVAGSESAIDALERRLTSEGIDTSRLHIGVAAHSHLVEPILEQFGEFAAGIDFGQPAIPIVSNLTGKVAEGETLTRPEYWVSHLRNTVRFVEGLGTALAGPAKLAVEVGPGQTLSSFARQHPGRSEGQTVVATLPHPKDETPDDAHFLEAVGKMWSSGAPVELDSLYAGERRRRVPLPTYPFERVRHWIDPGQPGTEPIAPVAAGTTPPQPPVEVEDRADRIRARVTDVLSELSGMSTAELDPRASFLELGFDSLFMTQASSALGSVFGLRISFRQLFEDAPTIEALSAWLDERLPPDALPAPATVSQVAGEPADPLAAITVQLEQLSRQVAALAGGDTPPMHSAPPPVADSPAPPPAPSGPWRPPSKTTDELDPAQRHHIDQLTERLTRRSPGSKQYVRDHRRLLADPRTVAGFRRTWKELVYPLVVDRSAGSKVWDIDGNEYLDIAMGFGVNLFGHSPSFVLEAVRDQIDAGIEIGPQTPLAGEVARLIAEMTGHERVAFSNTGSEAVLAAMRIARTVTGRSKILTFANDYHGLFDEVLARGVIGPDGSRRTLPIAPGIPAHASQDLVIFDYADPAALEFIATHASELAAVLVEPVQSRHPDLQPVEFLRSLREITRDRGVTLIFDEMITGFRSHPGGVQALFGVQADIATYGKVVGGGFPIGVVAGDARFLDALDGGHWEYGDDSIPEADVTWFAGTFVRHPVALAASRAALLHMRSAGEEMQAALNRRTTELVEDLNAFFDEVEAPIHIEHFSSLFLTKFEQDHQFSSLFYFHLRDQGIHVTEGRAAFLSTAHSDADLDHLRTAFRHATRAMLDARFLSGRAGTGTEGERPDLIPVTDGQQEILLAAVRDEKANAAYNLSNTLHVRGPVDVDVLSGALNDLVARHESLRVTFTPELTHQSIAPHLDISLNVVDLSHLDDEAASSALEEERRRDVETPFDLVNGPLVRASLIRLADDDQHLFLTVHHAVCDGWSSGTLLRRLSEIYTAYRRGESPRLPEAMSLREYVGWFEDYRNSGEYEEDRAFWIDHVGSEFPLTDLPLDHPRPSAKSFRSNRRTHRVESDLLGKLRELAADQEVTLFTLLLGSFECLLARLTGQDEVGFGVSMAGQTRFPGRDLVAHAVNAPPLRRAIDPEASFSSHLATTKAAFFDAFEHQGFSYGAIVREVRPPRDPGRTPLITTTFNMDSPSSALDMDGSEAVPGSNPRLHEVFDAFFNVVPHADHLIIECTYDIALFEAATIDRRLEEWETLLRDLVEAGPDRPVGDLALIPPADRARLEEWNATEATRDEAETLVTLMTAAADRWPDRVAVQFRDETVTHRQLLDQSRAFARRLKGLGVGRGATVGILCERSIEMVAAVYGTLLAGAAYVPLSGEYPAERIAYIVDEAEMPVVVCDAQSTHLLEGLAVQVLDVTEPTASDGSLPPPAHVSPDDPAYVIYTSGSTGRPKGVIVPHRAVVNLLQWITDSVGLQEDDRWLLRTPLVFDASIPELFGILPTGASVALAEAGRHGDPGYLVDTVRTLGVTTFQSVPSLLGMFLSEPGAAECRSLRRVICGGEALTSDIRDRFFGTLDAALFNHYGPTETTVDAAAIECRPDDGPQISIGRPIDNTQIHILDRRLRPVPVGAVGELCVGGRQLSLGYLKRPDLTAERFVEVPPHGVLYRTGDLGRWRSDGTIDLVGRDDSQVKISGYRVELGEIEAVLAEHAGVLRAAVLVHHTGEAARLIAYVAGSSLEPSEVKDWMKGRLPGYMVPSSIVVLESMPTTVNEKIDRRALAELDVSPNQADGSFVAPSTPMETEIADIWKQVIGLDRVGVADDFYDLGGHSLSAMQATARIRSAFGVELSLTEFHAHPTVGEQTLLVTRLLMESQMDDELASLLESGDLETDPSATGGEGR